MPVQSFKDLTVWRRSIEVVKEIYSQSSHFPEFELWGLTGQMRRAAVFTSANIAEGSKRKTTKDYLSFLRIAAGSAAELETLITISSEVYPQIHFTRALSLLTEVQKMLTALIRNLNAKT